MKRRRKQRFQGVSDAELGVLELLWEHGEATPQSLQEQLARSGVRRAYTTVQTLLHRLHAKGHVQRQREGVAQIYRATVDRQELLAAHMDDLAERLCGGETTPLLLGLVQSGRLGKRELARFREILDESEKKAKRRRRR